MLTCLWLPRHVETDSPTYSGLNGKFLIVQTDTSSLSFTPVLDNVTSFSNTTDRIAQGLLAKIVSTAR